MKTKLSLLALFFLGACTLWAQAPQSKVGVNTRTPAEVLDVNGTLRVRELPKENTPNSIFTKPDGSASNNKDQTYTAKKAVVADANGVLGQATGVQPNFFYMPAMVLPVDPATSHPNVTYDAGSKRFTVNLHAEYMAQFGQTNNASLSTAATPVLPLIPANELDFVVSYYDTDVFQNVTLTPAGLLSYQTKPNFVLTERSFFNILFKVK